MLFIIFIVGILEKFHRGTNVVIFNIKGIGFLHIFYRLTSVGLTTSLFKFGNSPPYAFPNPDISDTHPTSLPFYPVP